jgi:hypothetical protein
MGTMFLLGVEFAEAMVGDAASWELVEVGPADSTRVVSRRTVVVKPAGRVF